MTLVSVNSYMNKCVRHQGFNLTIMWISEQYLSFSRWHIKRFSGLVSNLYVVILRVIKSAFQIWQHRNVGEIYYMQVVSYRLHVCGMQQKLRLPSSYSASSSAPSRALARPEACSSCARASASLTLRQITIRRLPFCTRQCHCRM